MINEERFWEASVAEAVSEESPPDVTAKVLKELAEKEEPPKANKRGKVRFVRWALELGAAACVVVAIGLATGIIELPGKGSEEDPLPPTEVAGAPGAEYELVDGKIELRAGWLLVTTGAPTVTCEGSVLSNVDGRVLIHVGSMPPGERPESVENWLKANSVETDMVNNIKHWARGVGLAALVLSGTAVLDGQEIKAPEQEPQSTTEWHVIRSVMDIDNLPDGAKYVSADGINAAHLDFLAEVETLEGIRMYECEELRAEHLESLKKLPNLRMLDIREADWKQVPDLTPLLELKSLKRLGADLVAPSWKSEGIKYRREGEHVYRYEGSSKSFDDYNYITESLPILQKLSERGIEIELGDFDPSAQERLRVVLDALPTTRSIRIWDPSVGEMKMLSGHEALRSVDILDYREGQIGLAYLARSARLEELSLSGDRISIDEIHQISRMSGLRLLRLNVRFESSPEQCFEKIADMKGLRELELAGLDLSDGALPAFKKFNGREPLDRLWFGRGVLSGEYEGAELMLAQHVPTRRIELSSYNLYLWSMKPEPEYEKEDDESEFVLVRPVLPEVLRSGDAGEKLEVIRYEFGDAEFYSDEYDASFADWYKTYPNLKRIEVRRGGFDSPGEEDQFVRWLKINLPEVEVVVTP